MASKQALDGKYNIWISSEWMYPVADDPNHMRSAMRGTFTFPELFDAKLYILKLEQFTLAGGATGLFYVTQPPGGAQDFAPVALISVEGFSQLPGDSGLQSRATRSHNGIILSRLSTNQANSLAKEAPTPDQTPTTLVSKPTDGRFVIKITGLDLEPLFSADAAGNTAPIGGWEMCLSLQPVPDQEADRYFGR